MPGYYYFNCNGPVQVGPYGNYNEALQDCEDTYGGPCQFVGCSQPPCGAPQAIAKAQGSVLDAKFLADAEERARKHSKG